MICTGKRWDGLRLVGLLLLVVLQAAADGSSAQEPRPRAIVILDGSGSMWGPIDGTPKIEMTQQGIATLVDRLEGRADLGLLGYGHRRKGDCRDIELAFPPAPIDAVAAKAWIAKFSPRGKTPMASAVTTAGETLAASGKGGSIVVVTDGADNCRADPCAAASALLATDPALMIHVVILGTTDEDMSKTRCLAEVGHGTVSEVKTPAELAPALDRIVMAITGGSPTKASDPPASGLPGLTLSVRLGADGADVTEGLAWEVTRDGAPVYKGATPRPTLDVTPGRYHVKVSASGLATEQDVDVAETGATSQVLELDAGMLRVTLLQGTGASSIADAYYAIYRADASTGAQLDTIAVGRGSPPPMLLASGTYRAIVEQGLARIERTLTVEAGRDASADIAFDIGTLTLSARASTDGPVVDDVYFTVAEDDPESDGGRREITTSAAAEPSFTLRAGLYHVRAERGAARAVIDVTVRGGETTAETMLIPSGSTTFRSRIAGSPGAIDGPVSYVIESLEPAAQNVLKLNGPEASATLPEGRYRVTSRYGAGNAKAEKEFTVAAGTQDAVIVEHEAGVIAFEVEGATSRRLLQWSVKSPAGGLIWTSADPAPEVPLAAGDYQVEVKIGPRTVTERFNVAPGDAKTIRVRPE